MSNLLLLGTGGGGAAFDPATDPSTLFFATAKSDVTTDVDGVNEWGDPAFTTALQAINSRKPDEILDFEGLPAILCDGIAHRMDVAIALTPPFTLTARCMVPSSTSALGIWGSDLAGSSKLELKRGSAVFPAPGNLIRLLTGGFFSESTSDMTLGDFFTYMIHADTSLPFLRLFVGGIEESLAAQPPSAIATGDNFRLGLGGADFFDGYYRTLFANGGVLLDPVAVNNYVSSEFP